VSWNTASWLLGRDVTDEEAEWVEELSMVFIDSDYQYEDLIRAVVTSDHYRRVR